MAYPRIQNPIYNQAITSKSCFRHWFPSSDQIMLNYRKHNLWKAFVDFLFDNDEKVAC